MQCKHVYRKKALYLPDKATYFSIENDIFSVENDIFFVGNDIFFIENDIFSLRKRHKKVTFRICRKKESLQRI